MAMLYLLTLPSFKGMVKGYMKGKRTAMEYLGHLFHDDFGHDTVKFSASTFNLTHLHLMVKKWRTMNWTVTGEGGDFVYFVNKNMGPKWRWIDGPCLMMFNQEASAILTELFTKYHSDPCHLPSQNKLELNQKEAANVSSFFHVFP